MPFLALNGISLPVRDGTLRAEPIEIGERGRAFDGTAWSSIRARKRKWSFETPPLAQAESAAWRSLLDGVGHTADFETDTWTAQGVQGVLTGTAARSTALAWAGSASLISPDGIGNYCTFTFPNWPAWTVAFRRSVGGLFTQVVMRSSRYGTDYLRDGVVLTGLPPFAAWTAGALRLGGATGSVYYFDDLIVLPFEVPDSWILGMRTHPRALPALPTIEASGDMVGATPVVVRGRFVNSKTVAGMSGGALVYTLEQISVELEEA